MRPGRHYSLQFCLAWAAALALCSCNGTASEQYVFQSLSASPEQPVAGQAVTLHASVWDPYGYTSDAPSYEFEADGGELVAKSGSTTASRGSCVKCKSCDVTWIAPDVPGTYTIKAKYADVSTELIIRVCAKPGSTKRVGPPGL